MQESLSLVDEMAGPVWDQRKLTNGKRVEHPGCANQLCDALLYGWRHCYPYLATPEPRARPTPGSSDWYRAEAERMFEAELDELEARKAEQEPEGLGDSESWDPRFH